MAKRSRRERRLDGERQRLFPMEGIANGSETFEAAPAISAPTVVKGAEAVVTTARKSLVNFAQEYFYVYSELKTILIVTVLMFLVMVGLSFVI
jgi:hypothetical protein